MAGEHQVRHRASHWTFEIPCTPGYKTILNEKLVIVRKHVTDKLKTLVNNAYMGKGDLCIVK